MIYDFDQSLAKGKLGEDAVLKYLSSHSAFRPATWADERAGIDAWLETKAGEYPIQIKTDDVAARTGNAFIEYCHIFHHDGLWLDTGWLQKCEAFRLAYYTPTHTADEPSWRNILWLDPLKLRFAAREWFCNPKKYPTRGAVNKDYTTWGLLVPLSELRAKQEVFPS